MTVRKQIDAYMASQPEPKRGDMQALHRAILKIMPKCKLWFLDGKDGDGKIVTNPNIGYGECDIKLAGGKSRPFYNIGVSANTTGLSVYIMGLADKTYLSRTFSKRIGKASVTGYCIKFKSLSDVNVDVLQEAIRYGIEAAATP